MQGELTLSVQGSTTATSAEKNDFSIIFNYQDAGNYYFVSFNETNSRLTPGFSRSSTVSRRNSRNINNNITAGTFYNVRVERRGGAITGSA